MYKKIKNGSFMNLIWFIICAFPIMLLIIYSSSYLFDKQTGVLIDNKIILNNDFLSSNDGTQDFYNSIINERYSFYGTNYQINQENNIYIASKNFVGDTDVLNFDFNNNYDYYLYIQLNWTNDSVNGVLILNEEQKNFNSGEVLEVKLSDVAGFSVPYVSFESSNEVNMNFSIKLFLSNEKLSIYTLKDLENWNYYQIKNSYNNFLNEVNISIQTNGFISNAFLNLAKLFGVNNVYMSLACYYIEYLLVIILLHLAFDVLYILPNICHKFMEKIGGERD